MAGLGFVGGGWVGPRRAAARAERARMCSKSRLSDPYEVLGLEQRAAATPGEVKRAYLRLAREAHPDRQGDADEAWFDEVNKAYEILKDEDRRKIYDDLGADGVEAMDNLRARAKSRSAVADVDPLELEYLLETMEGQPVGSLEAGSDVFDAWNPADAENDDACPKSIEQAVWNVQNHEDLSYRYYAAWWIARFRVTEAEKTLAAMLQSDTVRGEDYQKLRRRLIVALGKIAKVQPMSGPTMWAIGSVLNEPDYTLRYNALEAIVLIADRNGGPDGVPSFIREWIEEEIKVQAGALRERKEEGTQETLFDFEGYDPEVAKKLKAIMRKRQDNVKQASAYNQYTGLSFDKEVTQPWEKLIKSACSLEMYHLADDVAQFTKHPMPLARFAANKFLYTARKDPAPAEELCRGLEYGRESPLTQFVVAMDLGDIGYVPGAGRVVAAPLVPQSIKLLAIRKMIDRVAAQVDSREMEVLMAEMDSLAVG